MPKTCGAADILLTTQVDKVLQRSRAFQRNPADRSPETQKIARVLCDQLDELVFGASANKRPA